MSARTILAKLTAAAAATLAAGAAAATLGTAAASAATTTNWVMTGWNIHQLNQISPATTSHFFNTPTSYATGPTAATSPVTDGFAATGVLVYNSYAQFAADLASHTITPSYQWVMYDPEYWALTPLAEQQNPAHYLQQFAQLAHANGLKVIEAPGRDLAMVPGSACPPAPGETLDHCPCAAASPPPPPPPTCSSSKTRSTPPAPPNSTTSTPPPAPRPAPPTPPSPSTPKSPPPTAPPPKWPPPPNPPTPTASTSTPPPPPSAKPAPSCTTCKPPATKPTHHPVQGPKGLAPAARPFGMRTGTGGRCGSGHRDCWRSKAASRNSSWSTRCRKISSWAWSASRRSAVRRSRGEASARAATMARGTSRTSRTSREPRPPEVRSRYGGCGNPVRRGSSAGRPSGAMARAPPADGTGPSGNTEVFSVTRSTTSTLSLGSTVQPG